MPELPDVVVYIERLEAYTLGRVLEQVRLTSLFLVRTAEPPLSEVHGKKIVGFRRIGKRIVFELEDDLFMVIHLMISGRLRWKKKGAAVPKRAGLAGFDFPDGTLIFTEQSKKKRASLHVVRGAASLADFDRGGIEVLDSSLEEFRDALTAENHTLKRALTDQRILSGIGNAYSDEILFHAKLSPFKQTTKLSDDEFQRLYDATVKTLTEWLDRLRAAVGDGFPDKVTAFHDDMAVHGRYRQPCVVCEAPVQRIRYASNEANYCAACQTGGKVLADRALSRLLKKNWPRTLEELEELRTPRRT